jgi:hypothetical protein
MIRHMELVLRSGRAGNIEIAGRLLTTITRSPVDLLDPAVPRTAGKITICSICRKVETRPDQWVEIESAITRQRLFTRKSLPQLDEQVCPACKAILVNAAK